MLSRAKRSDGEKKKRGRGQPPVDLTLPLRVFEFALMEGMTIHQALKKAEIPPSTYYDYTTKNPKYSETVAQIRDMLVDCAEHSVRRALEREPKTIEESQNQIDLARWVLKKRKAAEYGDAPSQSPQLTGGPSLNVNLGHQTVIRAEDLADHDLVAISEGKKSLADVLNGRSIATATKHADQ